MHGPDPTNPQDFVCEESTKHESEDAATCRNGHLKVSPFLLLLEQNTTRVKGGKRESAVEVGDCAHCKHTEEKTVVQESFLGKVRHLFKQ
jgi:hypothetical protein